MSKTFIFVFSISNSLRYFQYLKPRVSWADNSNNTRPSTLNLSDYIHFIKLLKNSCIGTYHSRAVAVPLRNILEIYKALSKIMKDLDLDLDLKSHFFPIIQNHVTNFLTRMCKKGRGQTKFRLT